MAGNSGEQRSFWVEHILVQIMRAELSGNLVNEFWILKVRESVRLPTREFTPLEWRFGLHNRDESLNMSDSEVSKRALVVLFGLDEDSRWTRFYNDVVPDSREMLKCYGLHKEVNDLLEAEIKQVLALDAFFFADAATPALSRSHHILDASYKVICGVDGMKRVSDRSQEDYIHVPSATRLKESGIKIEGVVGPVSAKLYDEKKCLFMPKMMLYDTTASMIRHMATYEENLRGSKCMFHDYILLMLDLSQAPFDMDYLVKCGVIYNRCGNKGVDVWRALDEGVSLTYSSKEHNKIKRDISNRCKLR